MNSMLYYIQLQMFQLLVFCLIAWLTNPLLIPQESMLRDKTQLFGKAILNYFGCARWESDNCVQCSQNYFFNKNQICCEIPPQCKNFNRQMGACQQCYFGYQVSGSSCIKINLEQTQNLGCNKFIDDICVECSFRWYFNEEGVCSPVGHHCRTWNQVTGSCISCYMGFDLKEEKCIQKNDPHISIYNPYCSLWQQDRCILCADRAYLGPLGICILISDFCKTWDNFDGYCLSCYKGYRLIDGECLVSDEYSFQESDIGCKIWDWQQQICLQCSHRWVMRDDSKCTKVSDLCKNFNVTGGCTSCYTGYELQEGKCSKRLKTQESDVGCKKWNWQIKKCLECSQRWFFHEQGYCVPVSDNCQSFNDEGQCTSCYRGFYLVGHKCLVPELQNSAISDPGCKIWNWQSEKCEECSYRWHLQSNSSCTKISDLCDQFQNGRCTNCYTGYQLIGGECKVIQNDFCAIKDDQNGCTECYPGYKIKNNQCIAADPLCRKSDKQGKCTSCFSLFALFNGVCVPLGKLANLARYYAGCCPQKLEDLKRNGRIG